MRRLTDVDVVVIGGGVQGLLILDSLMGSGYSCALVTEGDLGAGQTLHSHGFLNTGFGMMGPELPRAAAEIVYPDLRSRGVALIENWVLIPPPLMPMFDNLANAELPAGFADEFSEHARKLPSASFAKLSLVEALSSGREERVIRASVVGFRGEGRIDAVRVRRDGASASEELRASAIVVAAGCGSKRLLLELVGVTPQIERIKHVLVHILCLRAARIALPAISVVAMPLGLMVAAHPDGENVTWYVTPMEMDGPSFDDVPNEAGAEILPATLGRAVAGLRSLFPGVDEVEGLQAGAYAGYRQAIADGPTARMCERVDGTSNVVVALPSGLVAAWPNARSVVELVRELAEPSGPEAPLPGGGQGARIGNVVEARPGFAWSSWPEWSKHLEGQLDASTGVPLSNAASS